MNTKLINQLRGALAREVAKERRQVDALEATRGMIELINGQIEVEEKKK